MTDKTPRPLFVFAWDRTPAAVTPVIEYAWTRAAFPRRHISYRGARPALVLAQVSPPTGEAA